MIYLINYTLVKTNLPDAKGMFTWGKGSQLTLAGSGLSVGSLAVGQYLLRGCLSSNLQPGCKISEGSSIIAISGNTITISGRTSEEQTAPAELELSCMV